MANKCEVYDSSMFFQEFKKMFMSLSSKNVDNFRLFHLHFYLVMLLSNHLMNVSMSQHPASSTMCLSILYVVLLYVIKRSFIL